MTVLQITPGTFTLWKYHGGKASKGPLSACCQKPAGIPPVSPALPARVQSPVDFRALKLQQCGRVLGGINAFFLVKDSSNTVNFCQFCQVNSFRVKKHKLLEMDFTMKCAFVQRFPFALFFFLTRKTLKERTEMFSLGWSEAFLLDQEQYRRVQLSFSIASKPKHL